MSSEHAESWIEGGAERGAASISLAEQYGEKAWLVRPARHAAWRNIVCDTLGPLDFRSDPDVPLSGEIEAGQLGPVNVGRVLTRGQLIDRVWGADYVGDTKTLDVHVKRLRSKIENDPSTPKHLVTVRGLGYKFET